MGGSLPKIWIVSCIKKIQNFLSQLEFYVCIIESCKTLNFTKNVCQLKTKKRLRLKKKRSIYSPFFPVDLSPQKCARH